MEQGVVRGPVARARQQRVEAQQAVHLTVDLVHPRDQTLLLDKLLEIDRELLLAVLPGVPTRMTCSAIFSGANSAGWRSSVSFALTYSPSRLRRSSSSSSMATPMWRTMRWRTLPPSRTPSTSCTERRGLLGVVLMRTNMAGA